MGSDSDSGDDGDICLHSIDRDGDLLKTKNFGNLAASNDSSCFLSESFFLVGDKKKSRKRAKKKWKRLNKACVWTRHGQVKRWKGRDRLVIFLIGVAYGKDECNLGPLDDPGNDLAIFRDDHEEDDIDSDAGSDDDEDEDDKWVIMKVEKDAGGIRLDDFDKKKVAKKKFGKLERKGRVALLIKGGKVKDVTNTDSDKEEKEVTFMVGVAVGRGMLKRGNLGPLDEGGKYDIFDESDDDWGSDSDSD